MAADDKIEELIREIAAKHGIAVGRDDPILILQTINMKLMQDSASAQQEILDAFKSELESIAHRWGDDAKGKAERTLNAALAASKDAMTRGMQEGAKAAAEAVRREVEAVTAQLVAPILGWDAATVDEEVEHYRQRVEAERMSQTMPDDAAADAARLQAPDRG